MLALLIVVSVGAGIAPTVSAEQPLEPRAEDALRKLQDAAWVDTTQPAPVCGLTGGATDVKGGDHDQNAQAIMNYFVGRGLQPFQAAGIMGNMESESGLNPRALQPGTTGDAPIRGRGYGLVQWTYEDRQKPLEDRAVAEQKEVFDLGLQLDYVYWEMTESPDWGAVWDKLLATTNYTEATRYVEDHYEVHAGGPQIKRVNDARDFLVKYGSDATVPTQPFQTPDCDSSAGNGGNLVGDYHLPVDQKYFDANPEWFTKPHHEYPSADIPVGTNTKVYAVLGGTIKRAPIMTNNTSYGRGVWIDVGDGVEMIYAHGLDGGTISGAKEGNLVTAGQLIMHSDNTGNSSGPHLHFEIRVNGNMVCPQSLLEAIGKKSTSIPELKSLPTSGCTY